MDHSDKLHASPKLFIPKCHYWGKWSSGVSRSRREKYLRKNGVKGKLRAKRKRSRGREIGRR